MREEIIRSLLKPAELTGKIFSPEYVFLIQLWLVIGESRSAAEWYFPFLVLYAVSIGLPTFFLRYLVSRGHIEDMTLTNRLDRTNPKLFIVILLSMVGPFIIAKILSLPAIVYLFYLTVFSVSVIVYFLTFLLKVSGHALTITMTATIALFLNSTLGWWLFLFIPVVCTARVITRNHTLVEVAMGSLIGFIFPLITFKLL